MRFEDDNLWLSQKLMAELYDVEIPTIAEHLRNIFEDGEIEREATIRKFLIVQTEGKREVRREIDHYSLQAIIAVGFKINNPRAVRFRRWAGEIVQEYTIKGFALDDERLKGHGGGAYFKQLLARIRDIRSSEKAIYRQVLDLYATSSDYDPKSRDSLKFFKIVQNKFHYAVHRHTAAEVIYNRADADKDFMGLKSFRGDLPVLDEVRIAKNYLDEKELDKLNRLVSAYFELAEGKALDNSMMSMSDHLKGLDIILTAYSEGVLIGTGAISHEDAVKKAEHEYRKFQVKTLSPVENDYLKSLKDEAKKLEGKK
ncbi:MAG: virulence RhuM family protein [Candidatus Nomurabacteria bacterium]|nr:virulence RhuM family protein [Candidatus Nomurabacteria bacterium]